jgi:thiosulfate dehydrogenase [quinone] large subunit
MKTNTSILPDNSAGLFTLSLRLVVGWTYFSAFWRRLVLDYKLDPEAAGYIGEKFNHFLPNALGIKPLIQHLIDNPESLWWAMASFTIIEGVVGLFMIFGLFTRAMSVAVFGLAMGILLGSGWLGTTCLDEWQIGILGLAAGFTMFFTGSGLYSVDNYLIKKKYVITNSKWFTWVASGEIPINTNVRNKTVLIGSLSILFITLFTNQFFHGGVWGTLHNKSVKPIIEIAHTTLTNEDLSFQVYRVEGVDVYGSFLIKIELFDENGRSIVAFNGEDLSQFPIEQIENRHVAKVKPGKQSLIIPLGSKATLSIPTKDLVGLTNGEYTLKLTDISGIEWESKVSL